MSSELEDGSRNGDANFENGSLTEPHADRPRANRINRKRLESLSGDGKILQIWYRESKNGTMIQSKDLKNIPREAAGICSDLIDQKVIMKGLSMFYLPECRDDEIPIPIKAYKYCFEWIRKCGEQQKEVGIRDDHPLPEPSSEDLTTDVFTPIIDILRAATKLRIPHDSFGKFVVKQMLPLARKYLISLDLVKEIFDNGGPLKDTKYSFDLKEVAWSSIYDAWYMYKLDAEEFDDYMEELGEMRTEITELDEDLHAASEKKDQYLKAARERKRNRDSENTGGRFGNDDSVVFNCDDSAWAQNNSGGESLGWDQGDGDVTANAWDYTEAGPGHTAGSWAEEMNEDYAHTSAFEPAPAVPAGGW